MDQNSYRNLISGADGGVGKALLRLGLRGVALPYRAGVAARNLAYDLGVPPTFAAKAPVLSIGNLTTGGTGKTPLVIWLCRILEQRGRRPAVLTRGYKAAEGKLTDEPAILAKSCPDAKILVGADRVASAHRAVDEFGCDVLVMDDGFQHRRLRRDLDILAIDATCPFGYGRILPAGLLREPVRSLRRADAVVVTRYDQARPEDLDAIEKRIRRMKPDMVIARAVHRHSYAKMIKGQTLTLEELKGRRVFAFCGIGNPRAFLDRLRDYGIDLVGSRVFNDHYDYTEEDIQSLYDQAQQTGADLILSTHKDWVKTALLKHHEHEIGFAYLALELEFVAGLTELEARIDAAIQDESRPPHLQPSGADAQRQ